MLSKKKVDLAYAWKELEKAKAADETILGTVVNVVKGGVLVDVSGVRGFIPSSQLRARESEIEVGSKLELKILTLDVQQNNFILSNKKVYDDTVEEARKNIFSQIEPGQVVKGEVVRITDFGAFIDLGGLDGLLPLSQLSWRWIDHPNIGLLNQMLHLHLNWLYDSKLAMPALIVVSVWKLIGYNMIIFLSSLSAISQSLFEAAKIDGANSFQIFKNVTIPMLSPTIFFVVIITAISSFQVFDLIYLMTQGGPFDSTNVLVYAIYKNAFEYFNVGKASAIAYVLFVIILVLTLIQWSLRKKLVYNEK